MPPAVKDDNPRYFDDRRPGGIIAPPMFAVSLTWRVIERLGDLMAGSEFPFAVLATQVHYSEHISFVRPVRQDEQLNITGRIASIKPHRAGTVLVMRFEAVDSRGAPVFTEHIGGMLRGVECEGPGRELPGTPMNMAPVSWPETAEESKLAVEFLFPYIYDGCANIHFPIHTSPVFAEQVGLPGIIVQGTATLALAVREITNRKAGGDSHRVKALSCRFTDMVVPDSEIIVRMANGSQTDSGLPVHFEVVNSDGRRAISHGLVILEPGGV